MRCSPETLELSTKKNLHALIISLKSTKLFLITEETSNPIQLLRYWIILFHHQCYSPFRLSCAPVGFWIHGLFVCLVESKARLKQKRKSRSTAMHILSKLFIYFVCHKHEIIVERDIWVSHRDAGSEVQGSELALPWNCGTIFNNLKPVPVATRSKAWVCSRSPAEIVGHNPCGDTDVCLLWVLCVVR